jgi:hypothetical protein
VFPPPPAAPDEWANIGCGPPFIPPGAPPLALKNVDVPAVPNDVALPGVPTCLLPVPLPKPPIPPAPITIVWFPVTLISACATAPAPPEPNAYVPEVENAPDPPPPPPIHTTYICDTPGLVQVPDDVTVERNKKLVGGFVHKILATEGGPPTAGYILAAIYILIS